VDFGFGNADLTRPRSRNREAEVDGNSKLQITNNKQITMTEIQNSKHVWVIEYWNLKFICNLVLGICDFRHKTPRQSQISLTYPLAPDFSGLNPLFVFQHFT
jgi:hypothetical protein